MRAGIGTEVPLQFRVGVTRWWAGRSAVRGLAGQSVMARCCLVDRVDHGAGGIDFEDEAVAPEDGQVTDEPKPATRCLLEHPLDRALRQLGPEATSQERLEIVWRAYEEATKRRIARPPSEVERRDVLRWLRAFRVAPGQLCSRSGRC